MSILLLTFFNNAKADEYELNYITNNTNQSYLLYPATYSINWYNNKLTWGFQGLNGVFNSGGNYDSFNGLANSQACSSTVGVTFLLDIRPSGNWMFGRTICGMIPGNSNFVEVVGSTFLFPDPLDLVGNYTMLYGQNADDWINSYRLFLADGFTPGSNNPFPKVDIFSKFYLPAYEENFDFTTTFGNSQLANYGNDHLGYLSLYNHNNPNSSVLTFQINTGTALWNAPGYGFSTINGSELNYIELTYDNYYSNSAPINVYENLFVTYIASGDASQNVTEHKFDDNYLQFYDNGLNSNVGSFRTLVGTILTGYDDTAQFFFTIYDCYIPGLSNIRDNCSIYDEGRLPLNELGGLQARINGNQFISIDPINNSLTYGGFQGQQNSSYVWQVGGYYDIDYWLSGNAITGNIAQIFTGTSPDYTYTPPIFSGNDNGTGGGGGGSRTNDNSLSGFYFSGYSGTGSLFNNCPQQYLSSTNLVLYVDSLPLIGSVLSEITGFSGVNLLGPFSCMIGALNYGYNNLGSVPNYFSGTTHQFTISGEGQDDNLFSSFLAFLIAIPGIFLAFKIIRS